MHTHAARVLLLVVLLGACRPPRPSSPLVAVDFIKEFDRAEKRPAEGFSIRDYEAAGTIRPAIIAVVPSRLTWAIPIPRRAVFRALVACGDAPVRVRVGVSDSRIYEERAALTVTPSGGWSELTADLSPYAGWKFSLFYRPDGRTWRVNLSADAAGGAPAHLAWATPEILVASADALEYRKRRLRITRSGAP